MRILILSLNKRLGDAVLISSVIQSMRAQYPNAHIQLVLGNPKYPPLFHDAPVQSISSLPNRLAPPAFTRPARRFYARTLAARLFLKPFNIVVAQGLPPSITLALTSPFRQNIRIPRRRYLVNNVPKRLLFPNHLKNTPAHTLHNIAHSLNVPSLPVPRLTPTAQSLNLAQQLLPNNPLPVLSLSPASTPPRTWPTARYHQLAQLLLQHPQLNNARVVVHGGPNETKLISPLIQSLQKSLGKSRVIDAVAQPFPVVVALASRSTLHIGAESGLCHLAAAAGTPALSICHRPSYARRCSPSSPWGAQYSAVCHASGQNPSINANSVQHVQHAAVNLLKYTSSNTPAHTISFPCSIPESLVPYRSSLTQAIQTGKMSGRRESNPRHLLGKQELCH